MSHLARATLVAAAASTLTALTMAAALAATPAAPRVDTLTPFPVRHTYRYFLREVTSGGSPLRGRTVTMVVEHAPGPDAVVAPSTSDGAAAGPAGSRAQSTSGNDGLVYFLLTTSATPGENDWAWNDGTFSGVVVAVGVGPTPTPTPTRASPSPPPAVHSGDGAGSSGHGALPVIAGVLTALVTAMGGQMLVLRRFG